jgi:hypothetical protein
MDLECRYGLGGPGDRNRGTRFRRSPYGFDQQMTPCEYLVLYAALTQHWAARQQATGGPQQEP